MSMTTVVIYMSYISKNYTAIRLSTFYGDGLTTTWKMVGLIKFLILYRTLIHHHSNFASNNRFSALPKQRNIKNTQRYGTYYK